MKTKMILLGSLALAIFSSAIAAEGGSGVALKKVAEGFVSPTGAYSIPGTKGMMLLADQVGVAYAVNADGSVAEKPFLDLRPKMCKLNDQAFDERGLLSMAFSPKFATTHKVYAVYSAPKRDSAPANWNSTLTLSEFEVSPDGISASLGSERVLLQIDKPYFNHNGGSIAFGADGFLYMSVGDGGNAHDIDDQSGVKGHTPEIGNGQDTQVLLAKIVRIDVDHPQNGKGYGIPRDNPFADGKKGKPEIFAYGVRNPWRISFDRGGKHELFAADVGQDLYEEVDIIVNGGNYGWNIREGFHCFDPKDPKHPAQDCPKVGRNGEPLLDPIFEYKHTSGFGKKPDEKGISITGGYVYRGKALSQLAGKYVFADWSQNFVVPLGVLMTATQGEAGKPWKLEDLVPASHPNGIKMFIVSMGEDADGELYVMTNDSSALKGKTGKLWKLAPM